MWWFLRVLDGSPRFQRISQLNQIVHYYIGNGTLPKENYTAIKECTLLEDTKHFMYLTQSYFSDNTLNQILHIMSTLLSWLTNFYATVGKHPTLYDFLAST